MLIANCTDVAYMLYECAENLNLICGLFAYCHESEFIKHCILAAGALSPKKFHDGMKGAQVAPELIIFDEFEAQRTFSLNFIRFFNDLAVAREPNMLNNRNCVSLQILTNR